MELNYKSMFIDLFCHLNRNDNYSFWKLSGIKCKQDTLYPTIPTFKQHEINKMESALIYSNVTKFMTIFIA